MMLRPILHFIDQKHKTSYVLYIQHALHMILIAIFYYMISIMKLI